jgi:pimeloyl-ACP methyl ester carboxylesterase
MPGEKAWTLTAADGLVLRGLARPGTGISGVFLHGFRSDCDGGKARRLSRWAGVQDHPWLRFDQRGCGRSDGEFRQFTIGGAVRDLCAVLETLPGPCILVGSSLGALIAAHAARQSHRVAGLLLIAPAVRFADRFIRDQLDREELDRWLRRGYRWLPDLYNGGCFRLDAAFCEDALRNGAAPGALPCPVRAVHGSRDELLPPEDTERWLETLASPDKALEILEGGDHRLTDWVDAIVRQAETLWNETRHPCA